MNKELQARKKNYNMVLHHLPTNNLKKINKSLKTKLRKSNNVTKIIILIYHIMAPFFFLCLKQNKIEIGEQSSLQFYNHSILIMSYTHHIHILNIYTQINLSHSIHPI